MNQFSYGLKIDYRKCNGCGLCYKYCPVDIFTWDKERKQLIVAYPEECFVYGVCEYECPQMCIDIVLPLHYRLDRKIDPESIR